MSNTQKFLRTNGGDNRSDQLNLVGPWSVVTLHTYWSWWLCSGPLLPGSSPTGCRDRQTIWSVVASLHWASRWRRRYWRSEAALDTLFWLRPKLLALLLPSFSKVLDYSYFSNVFCFEQPTFLYHSALWTNRTAYNVPGGSSLNASEETKLPTYWETPFSRICLGMTVAGQTNYLAINYTADSLYSLIADGQYRATTLGRDAWKALISGSSLQVNCNKGGFNALPIKTAAAKVRIGITSNNQNDCKSNNSRLGFGTGGWPNPKDSCGNAVKHRGDNGDKSITAFGYIFVQWGFFYVGTRTISPNAVV